MSMSESEKAKNTPEKHNSTMRKNTQIMKAVKY